jgi:hypothetical protein
MNVLSRLRRSEKNQGGRCGCGGSQERGSGGHGSNGAGGGGATGGARPRDDGPPDRRRQALRQSALFSVCFHSLSSPEEHGDVPFFMKPWSIDQTLDYLLDQEDDPRVVAHAGAWLVDARHRSFESELATLLGRDAARDLFKALGGFGELLPNGNQLLSARAGLPSRFEAAYEFLGNQLGLGSCKRRNFFLDVQFDPATFVTSLSAQIDVDRAASNFSATADPQNWSAAAPLFFTDSKRGQANAGRFRPIPPNPPPAGSQSWTGGLLEGVTMSYNPFFPISAQNVLNARYGHNPTAATTDAMRCDLHRCAVTSIGFSRTFGGLDVDSGSFDVIELSSTDSQLVATKRVRATERDILGFRYARWINLLGRYWLAPWGAALVYEAACSGA